MKVAVIGAGISGISAGKIIQDRGHSVTLFEKHKIPGGLVRCDFVEGNLFHRVGGHVFNSKNKAVLDWFWSFFDKEIDFLKARRNAGIFMNGNFYGYPIENYLYQFSEELVEKIVRELFEIASIESRDPMSYPDFEFFLKDNFGPTLYRLYFEPYNRKIWNTDLKKIPMNWLEGKLPMPDYKKIIASNITRREESEMVHSTFFYPHQGGSQFIIDRLAEGLDIKTDFLVSKLEYGNKGWFVNEEGPFSQIIYTIDIRKLPEMISLSSASKQDSANGIGVRFLRDAVKDIQNLKSNGTSNVLCYTDETEYSWLYIPDPEIRSHRIIYTGNFSEANNAHSHRKTCVVEFSGCVSDENIKDDLRKLPGNLSPLAFSYEPNSYVIQNLNTRNLINRVKDALKPMNLFLAGRFAEWEYYNMDAAIASSMQLINYEFPDII